MYHKWNDYGWYSHEVDGEIVPDWEKHKSFDCWEEAIKILNELLATSLDDSIRNESRYLLALSYSRIGDDEKILEIAEKCDIIAYSKQCLLANTITGKDSKKYQQEKLMGLLCAFRGSLPNVAKDTGNNDFINEAYEAVINLYKLIFSDGNYGFYSVNVSDLYLYYSWELIRQHKFEEAFEAIENQYIYTEMFDKYLDEVREKGEYHYTSPFVNFLKDTSEDIYAAKQLPGLLTILKTNDVDYGPIRNEPKFIELVNKIEASLN